MVDRACWSTTSRASRVRALAARQKVLIFDQAGSIGARAAALRNDLTDSRHFMRAQVIQHDHSARAQRGAKDLRRIRVNDLSIRGPLHRHDRLKAVQGESRHDGQVGAIVLWHGTADAFPPGCAAEPTRHGQVHARLVDTRAALEIERLYERMVIHPRLLDPGGGVRCRVERLLLRGHPKRRTTRHMIGTLTRMPVMSAARVPNSSQVASG
jgi:hypothetical protein